MLEDFIHFSSATERLLNFLYKVKLIENNTEELNNLKGDSSKLRRTTNWAPEYTFETMLDEMINYWLNYYKK